MLSILIPVFNFNVVQLIKNIQSQAEACQIEYEIICLDDGSRNDIITANNVINELKNTSYLKNEHNIGRNQTRLRLCEKARYDWLLFLDADVLPKNNKLIANYLNLLDAGYEAIYGGFAYDKKVPEARFKLRWEYGRKHEQVEASKRNTKPYKVIISANFIIRKSVFTTINKKIVGNFYGEDNQFGALLKSHNIKVMHIDNEVYHLGIEPSEKYLQKKEQAALTLLHFYKNQKHTDHENDLLSLYERLKRYRLSGLFAFFFKFLKRPLRSNLLGNSPSIMALQLYRISYMCHMDAKSS